MQGLAGIIEIEQASFKGLAYTCQIHGIKLIVDEVQSGFGRTGCFFAYQHYHVQPDMVAFAKGAGNGFPVGGVLIKKDIPVIENILGSAFGGNYLAC